MNVCLPAGVTVCIYIKRKTILTFWGPTLFHLKGAFTLSEAPALWHFARTFCRSLICSRWFGLLSPCTLWGAGECFLFYAWLTAVHEAFWGLYEWNRSKGIIKSLFICIDNIHDNTLLKNWHIILWNK